MKKNTLLKRLWFFGIVVMGSIIGILSRSSLIQIPEFFSLYTGDTIWAFTAYYLIAFLFPKMKAKYRFLSAISFSVFIELSQLLKYEWLESLREFKIVGLMIGYGFKWSDLLCYLVGCLLALGIDLLFKLSEKQAILGNDIHLQDL